MAGSRGVGSGKKHTWKTALDATPDTDVEGVGTIREEHGPQGYRRFVWVKSVQSDGCTAGDVLMYGMIYGGVTVSVINGTNSALTVIAGGGNISFVTGTVGTDAAINGFVDDWIVITSTVAAGNAPELEVRKIKSNTTNRFFVATDFSVAPSVLDGFSIIRPYAVINAVSSSAHARIAGIAMADASANDYLWVQTRGLHFAVNVDTQVQAINGPALVGGAAAAQVMSELAADSLGDAEVGFFVTPVQAGLAAQLAPIMLSID